jgi:hypothetical protein
VPVIVTMTVPVVAVLLPVSVNVLVLAVLLGLNDAVTPLGRPDADKLTLALKPFCGVTVMALAPLAPCAIVKLLGDAERVCGAHVQGTVLNEDTLPAVGAWVVAIPDKKTRRASYSANTDQYGHFEVRGLPPGKYKLFSWAGLQEGTWEDPEFLKEYEAKATVIEVNEGDTMTVELKLIPIKETEVASE